MTGAVVSVTLLDEHDAVLLDLDGTVYRGGQPIAGAEETIAGIRRRGTPVRYVTNNASKPPDDVARTLESLGLSAEPAEVSTSAQAGAAELARHVFRGSRVLVVGAAALEAEVADAGLIPVRRYSRDSVAVVQGHSPETRWSDLAEACLVIRHGAVWVACNRDATLPTERGELPGNGAMVAALEVATGCNPVVAGKPERPLMDRAISSAEAHRPLMVGDRLETDIAGAVRAGVPSLMVLTGVGTPADLLFAVPGLRPEYVAADMTALWRPPEDSAITGQPDWKVQVEDSALVLFSLNGDQSSDELSALRALCAAWWPVGSGRMPVRGGDEHATSVLHRLDLSGG